MGAVQKLATVVIVGLVGLATLLVVYAANEGNRTAAEAQEQQDVAVERGIETYHRQLRRLPWPWRRRSFRG